MTKHLDKLLKYITLIMSLFILIVILLAPLLTSRITYALPFVRWNSVILLASGLLFGGAFWAGRAIHRRIRPLKHPLVALAIVAKLSFFVALPWIHSYFFKTGWDVRVVTDTAMALGQGTTEWADWVREYFSRYPNNILIMKLYSWMYGAVASSDSAFMVILWIQAALNSLAGYLLGLVIYRQWHRQSLMWFGYGLYLLLVGFSPWTSIPYSDALGLLFPIALLALYQSSHLWGKIIGLSVLTAIGYAIKPQSVIVMIAITLITLAYSGIRYWKQGLLFLVMSTALFVGVRQLKQVDAIPLDPNMEYSLTHFLKMGLNDVTDGGYYEADVLTSGQAATTTQRRQENLATVQQRLRDYGPIGLLRHQVRKTIVNYADGTFGWGLEGSFFLETHDTTNPLSRFSRSLYYEGHRLYPVFQFTMQIIWLLVLTLALGNLFLKRLTKTQRVLFLSLIGIFLFESLFEARARYLYTYVPLFILSAVSGVEAWLSRKEKQ